MVLSVLFAIVWALAHGSQVAMAESHRSMNDVKGNPVLNDFDPKTTGQKWSSGEYHTLSSLTSSSQQNQQHDDHYPLVVDDNQSAEEPKMDVVHLELTTDMPPFLMRSKYVKSPAGYLYNGGRSTEYYQDSVIDDQRPEYSTSIVNVVPKWNKYYSGHRQLKNYGVGPGPTDLDAVKDGNGIGPSAVYGEYDNAVDYSYSGANYDPESYKTPKGDSYAEGFIDGGDYSLYSGPVPSHASSRPAPTILTTARLPKMTTGMQKLGWVAIALLGVGKLLVFKVVKFFVLLAVKLKLLVLFKMFLYAKFFVISKFFKLIILPFIPYASSLLNNLLMMMVSSSSMTPMMAMMMPMTSDIGTTVGTFRNSSTTTEPANMRSTNVSKIATTENLLQLVSAISSAKCAEKLACHVAGTRSQSFQSLWMDWILSSLVNYIPNRKFKSYLSTFKDVSNYRLENIFNNPSTEEWLKWCDERYSCSEEASIDNNLV